MSTYKILLIDMPFSDVRTPSFALTQLKSILESNLGDQVSVELLYLNQKFSSFFGIDFYQHIALSGECLISGLGDWIFRQSAFPELPDNTQEYFMRYYPRQDERTQEQKRIIQDKRKILNPFLDELIEEYNIDKADLVGFTSTFSQSVACMAMAKRLKDRKSNIITVMGGANCQWPMGGELVNNVEQIDFVFSGPALKSFPKVVQHCLDQEIEKCDRVHGVFSKTNQAFPSSLEILDSSIDYVKTIGDELDINTEIELEYEPFLNSVEENSPQLAPTLFFETSRGCWWGEKSHCTFCGENGLSMNYRAMTPENAIKQFHRLFRYSDRCTRFFCTDSIMQRDYVEKVFPFIETPPNVRIGYEVKADLSLEELRILSKAGVNFIQPGIESFSNSTLKLMKKGCTGFGNVRFLKNCLLSGVYPGWNILVGLPGENESVYEKYVHDFPLLTHLPPPTGIYPIRFDRFSAYFEHPKEYGLDLQPYNFYELVYPFSKESLAKVAYYFSDENIADALYFITMSKWYNRVKEKGDFWQSLWSSKEKSLPRLCFQKNGEYIYDSRSGEAIEHRVGDMGRQVLEYLDSKPRRVANLAKDLSHISGFDPETEIALLQERGLIYQDGDRFISLVLPNETSVEFFELLKERSEFDF